MNRFFIWTTLFMLCVMGSTLAQNQIYQDLNYADDQNTAHLLDLTVPASDHPLPLIVFIHGGAWTSGDKSQNRAADFVRHGYAVASINYRLSNEAKWPAQIHDCKGAIRWLRAHADNYHIDQEQIGVWGSSAGGHLVSMLGTTSDVTEIQIESLVMDLEGNVGGNSEYSSAVQAVCDYYGPSNFVTMGDYPSQIDHNSPNSPESKLLGIGITEDLNLARSASPVTYISPDDPPFIIFHGTEDPTVPYHQSVELDSALQKAGVNVTFVPMEGSGHGGREFETNEIKQTIREFFDQYLKPSSSIQIPFMRDDNSYQSNFIYAPGYITLQQNFPNPFNPGTAISFTMPQSDHIRLTVYNTLGREIDRIFQGTLSKGEHTLHWQPDGLNSGVYIVRLETSKIILTKRMTLTK